MVVDFIALSELRMESYGSMYSKRPFAVMRITLSLLLCWLCCISTICHGQVFTCPTHCQCFSLSVDCSGDNLTLSRVVQDLPANIESIKFTVHPWSLYKENRLYLDDIEGLGKFKNLLSFQIQPNSTSAPLVYDSGLRNDTFCNWVDLKEIHLNIRTIYDDSYDDDHNTFLCLQQLEVLDLSYSMGIQDIALRNLLSTKLSRHITTLLLRNIQTLNSQETTKIDFSTLFSNLNRSCIEVIDLSANAIRDAHPGLLSLPNLKVLDLSENLLIYPLALTPGAVLTLLEGLLHPSMTNFSFSNPGLFVSGFWHPSLKSVSLANPDLFSSSCEQKRKPSSTGFSQLLANCSRISKPLSRCEDKEVWSELQNIFENFKKNSSLCPSGFHILAGRHLEQVSASGLSKYSYSYINPLPQRLICFNPSNILKTIDISNNHFGLIIDNPTLTNITVKGLQRIKSLNFANNDFLLNNFHFFDAMPSLEQLLLGGNKIPIHNDSQNELFKFLSNLRDLDLSQNDLRTLPYAEFAHLSKIQRLDLSDNRLSDLNIQLPNSSLRMLNLSSNGMTSLQASMADQFDKYPLLNVDLQDNNFICNCKALWFVRWVQTTPVSLTRKEDLYCYTEEGHVPIAKINYRELYKKCHRMSPFEIALIAASAVLCFILLVIGLVVVYRQRWRIRHYWYRRRLRQERFLLNDDYEYDAYVSYVDSSREVRGWVSGAMHEELECNRGLKLFIHQRDLLAGGFFLERIDAAMRKCRKTILVLSPEFLQSRTCLYEAWSAHTSMVTENRDAVVLVKLQPLPLTGITGTLASLMQIRQCLNWTADPIGQNLFWEQLEDVLLSVDNPIID